MVALIINVLWPAMWRTSQGSERIRILIVSGAEVMVLEQVSPVSVQLPQPDPIRELTKKNALKIADVHREAGAPHTANANVIDL